MRFYFDDGYYDGDGYDETPDGYGTIFWYDGSSASGYFSDGEMIRGTIRYTDGCVYEGAVREDFQRHGQGKMKWTDGDWFEGEFYYGHVSNGTFHSHDGAVYQGSFDDEWEFHDQHGILIWSDGDRYEGAFVHGKRDGQGTYYYKSGNKFVGTFSKSKRVRGTFYYTDGAIYQGSYDDKELWHDLHGAIKLANGDRYEGGFVNGEKEGKGTYYYNNGNKFVGTFSKNKKVRGTFYFASGVIYEGPFDSDGYFCGKGKYISKNGDVVYEGEFKKDKFNGYGVHYSTTTKYRYEGYFKDDVRNGHGKVRFADQDDRVYEGEFIEGKINGLAFVTFDDGRKGAIYFDHGKKGEGKLERINGEYYYTLNGVTIKVG